MSKVTKAIKKFTKGFEQLQEVYNNKGLEGFKESLIGVSGFFTYPEPNSPIAKPAAWTIVPVDAPYNPIPQGVGDPGEEYQETLSAKSATDTLKVLAISKIRKARKNFNRGFKLLKKRDEDLFDKLGLLEAKETISQYAQDLVDGILGRERVLEDEEYYSSDTTL